MIQGNSAKKLGFGCMRLPLLDPAAQTSVDFLTLNAMVDAFLNRGFTYFDTALTYHAFTSEAAMRRALVERHPRDSFKLASKLPPRELHEDGDIERIFSLYNSTKRAVTTNVSSQFVYYLNLAATHGAPGDCIACGACEESCPQHLEIPALLSEVAQVFANGPALPKR